MLSSSCDVSMSNREEEAVWLLETSYQPPSFFDHCLSCLQGIIQMQPLSADEAQRLYEQKEEAEKVLSEQRLVEQERQQVRNEVLMRYNDGLRDVTAAVKQINEKVQWLSASLGSKFTVLDYEKSGTRSGLEAVERLTVQSKKLKVCMWICTVHAHIYVYIAPLHSFPHLHVSSCIC